MIHTIIFDVGGTLVDAPDIFDILSEGNQEIKKKIVERFQKLYAGKEFYSVKEILNKVARDLSLKIHADKVYTDTFINRSYLFKESLEVLESMKGKIDLIIASDADSDVLIPELKKLGIHKYFSTILISSEFKAYKPSDKFIEKMRLFLKKPYNNILFVGDSSVDMETAKKIGAKSVYIRRTPKRLNSDYEITNLKELSPLL